MVRWVFDAGRLGFVAGSPAVMGDAGSATPGRNSDGPTCACRPAGGPAVGGGRGPRPGPAVQPRPPLLLPLLLLPAQLLAHPGPALAGALRGPVHAAARLHGLPALPRAALALR